MGKVGVGMKPRGQKSNKAEKLPTAEGQPKSIIAPVLEKAEQEQKGGSLDPKTVQNLESAEEPKTAVSVAYEGEAEAKTDAPVCDRCNQPYTWNPAVDAFEHDDNCSSDPLASILLSSKTTDDEKLLAIELDKHGDLKPSEAKKPTIAEIEEAIDRGDQVTLQPNGQVDIIPLLGQQPDGTFKMLTTVQEGYIEPIRQWAAQDGKTPEQWVDDALASYIESWCMPAKGR